jgi:hypothetical protein
MKYSSIMKVFSFDYELRLKVMQVVHAKLIHALKDLKSEHVPETL